MVSIKIDKKTMSGIKLLSKQGFTYGNGTLTSVVAQLVHKAVTENGLGIACSNGYFEEYSIVEDTNGRITDNPTNSKEHNNKYIVHIHNSGGFHLSNIVDPAKSDGQVIDDYHWDSPLFKVGLAWSLKGVLNEDGTNMTLKDVLDGCK